MARLDQNPQNPNDRDHLSHNGEVYRHTSPEDVAQTILLNDLSWSAVFAGVAVGLVAQILLNMIGAGVGIGTIDVNHASGTPTASGFSTGAAIWWAISGIIASGIGGYTAGRLSGRPESSTAGWHGVTSWAFTTLLLFYFVTSAIGSVVGGALYAAGSAANAITGPAIQSVAPTIAKSADPLSGIDTEIRANAGDQAAQREQVAIAVRDMITATDPGQQQQARDRAATALARVQNIPKDQAATQITTLEQQFRQRADQAKQAATRAADQATRVLPWTMISTVIALLLGAIAAWWGGKEAAVSPNLRAAAERWRERRTAHM